MKSPKRRRPQIRVISPPSGIDLEQLAERVHYVGSPEHKDTPSFAGHPRPRANASICDRRFIGMQEQLTEWLSQAIIRGCVSPHLEGDFPRYAWYKDDNIVYEARLVNRGTGEYKGWPLNKDEWPNEIEKFYE